ncbi:NAD-dependent deacylase [Novipirellula artificiosorum]|uniref:NAD-dependent protein deacylase n=1 Tax=Novipirellula artificiosorum TaxID=2528016 RepID=A0A5C6CEZ3_9BACT|nr:NAD-dependent deacylase [Novipirellula artificiosorum]TWU21876.1 NAD-dependent protein deacylase [Novipirellula artificiosorum]
MKILVLTGAGISAESGVPTFRDASGLWEGHRFEEVATPEAFVSNPALVHDFYNQRRRSLQSPSIQPNAAHLALAKLEREHDDDFLLVTQNIDNLHQRAGSQNLIAMHGELLKVRCLDTDERFDWTGDLDVSTPHPKRSAAFGRLRPHVVWFGEMPLGLEQIEAAASQADLFLSIGTSAVVYPAAAIVQWTRPNCRRVEINLEATPSSGAFDQSIRGKATVEVPAFLATLG